MADSLSMSLSLAMPELILAVGALALLMVGVYSGERSSGTVTFLAILLMIVAGAWIILFGGQGVAFDGAFQVDSFARFMKVLSLLGSMAALFMSGGYIRAERFEKFEYPVLIVLSTLGMMLMISASNMIGLYLGLELQSLSIYVLAAIHREDLKSSEAGLKYFVLGALSSGLLLYGISLVYGYTGNTGFHQIAAALSGSDRQLGMIFGLVFVLAGIAFKISAVPFHMWTPDVYEGAPTPVTAFLASAPKMAAMALMVRVTVGSFEPIAHQWQQIIVFISIASMVLGAFAAVGQRNIKRADGLLVDRPHGIRAGRACGEFAGRRARHRDLYADLSDDDARHIRSDPVDAAKGRLFRADQRSFGPVADASHDGDDPHHSDVLTGRRAAFRGFWGKWYVFLAAINANLYALAVIGVLASVVGAFYYLRIVKIMWFDEPVGAFLPMSGSLRLVLGISGLFVLFYVLIGGPVSAMAEVAAKSFF